MNQEFPFFLSNDIISRQG